MCEGKQNLRRRISVHNFLCQRIKIATSHADCLAWRAFPVCMCVYVCACVCACVCTCMCACVYVHVCEGSINSNRGALILTLLQTQGSVGPGQQVAHSDVSAFACVGQTPSGRGRCTQPFGSQPHSPLGPCLSQTVGF